jgi:hypothetical protein
MRFDSPELPPAPFAPAELDAMDIAPDTLATPQQLRRSARLSLTPHATPPELVPKTRARRKSSPLKQPALLAPPTS